MTPINVIWHRLNGSKTPGQIVGFSSATIEDKEDGKSKVKPVGIVRIDTDTRLKYVDLKYLELTPVQAARKPGECEHGYPATVRCSRCGE